MNRNVHKFIGELGDDMFKDIDASTVTHKFGRYVREPGLNGLRLHSLRHTLATRLVANKLDIYTVSLLLGHSDIRTSMVHAKTDMNLLQDVVKTIEDGYDLVTRKRSGKENRPKSVRSEGVEPPTLRSVGVFHSENDFILSNS